MLRVYIRSVKDPNKVFEVVKFDADTETATLRGSYADFEIKPFNKQTLTKQGYALEKVNA